MFASDNQTEFVDKPCLTLQCGNPAKGDQDGLIRAVAGANKNTVVVLMAGGPVLTPWADDVRAILEAWYPGAEGGTAIARVLFGDVDPGGRLPVTFPQREEDLPTAAAPSATPASARTPSTPRASSSATATSTRRASHRASRSGTACRTRLGVLRPAHRAGARRRAWRARVTATIRNTSGRPGSDVRSALRRPARAERAPCRSRRAR